MLVAYLVFIYLPIPKEKQFCSDSQKPIEKILTFTDILTFLSLRHKIFLKKRYILSLLLKRNEEDKVAFIHSWSNNF